MGKLILTRKAGEAFHINDDITVSVECIRGKVVRIGIEAPHIYSIKRRELVPTLPVDGVTSAQQEADIEDRGSAVRPPKSLRDRLKRNGGLS